MKIIGLKKIEQKIINNRKGKVIKFLYKNAYYKGIFKLFFKMHLKNAFFNTFNRFLSINLRNTRISLEKYLLQGVFKIIF